MFFIQSAWPKPMEHEGPNTSQNPNLENVHIYECFHSEHVRWSQADKCHVISCLGVHNKWACWKITCQWRWPFHLEGDMFVFTWTYYMSLSQKLHLAGKQIERVGKVLAKLEKKISSQSAPLGSNAITFCKWSSVCPASRSLSVHEHYVNKATRASVWKVRGCLPLLWCGLMRWLRRRRGHDVNSWSITVEKGVSPRRRLTEFDKAVSAGRLCGRWLASLQEPRLCMRMNIRGSDER